MQFKSAEAHFQKALNLNPKFMKAYDNLGLTYEALADYDVAVRVYRQAIPMNRSARMPSPWPPLNLGALLVKLPCPMRPAPNTHMFFMDTLRTRLYTVLLIKRGD
jgi:tetratricopeptide (TPR) repeat protein